MHTTCCLMVIHLYAKILDAYVKEQRPSCPKQIYDENIIFEVKGQCQIRIMNVRDKSSHGDRCMCKIIYGKSMSNQKKVMGWTQTDGQTERQTDKVIPIYPLNFVQMGYN